MEYSVRNVKEDDAQSIIELLNPIIRAGTYTIMDQLSIDDQIDFIRNFPERGVFNVAVCHHNQKILGLQDIQPISIRTKALKHVAEISTFVALDSHRNGVGQSLSRATFQEAQAKGFLKISAMVRADNPQAVSFYQNLGFKIIGTAKQHAFVGGKYIDEILMEKFIN
jgi:L-amino acid N-acyltransferase YncA